MNKNFIIVPVVGLVVLGGVALSFGGNKDIYASEFIDPVDVIGFELLNESVDFAEEMANNKDFSGSAEFVFDPLTGEEVKCDDVYFDESTNTFRDSETNEALDTNMREFEFTNE